MSHEGVYKSIWNLKSMPSSILLGTRKKLGLMSLSLLINNENKIHLIMVLLLFSLYGVWSVFKVREIL